MYISITPQIFLQFSDASLWSFVKLITYFIFFSKCFYFKQTKASYFPLLKRTKCINTCIRVLKSVFFFYWFTIDLVLKYQKVWHPYRFLSLISFCDRYECTYLYQSYSSIWVARSSREMLRLFQKGMPAIWRTSSSRWACSFCMMDR